jgi:predicted anti-sigma-YlaC factor YlaD
MDQKNDPQASPQELGESGAQTPLPAPPDQQEAVIKITRQIKLKPKVYTTKKERATDFMIGSALFLVLNAILLGLYLVLVYWSSMNTDPLITAVVTIATAIPLIINIALIIFLAFTRPWMALGLLGTIAFLLALVLVLSVLALVACFIIYSQST